MKCKMATTQFESDLNKNLADVTFGKTMEDLRRRVNVRLIADENKVKKATSKPTFKQCEIINVVCIMNC